MDYIHVGGFYFNGSSRIPNQGRLPSNWLSKPMNWGWWSLIGTINGNRPPARGKLTDSEKSGLTEERELFSFMPEAITYVQSASLLSAMATHCTPILCQSRRAEKNSCSPRTVSDEELHS